MRRNNNAFSRFFTLLKPGKFFSFKTHTCVCEISKQNNNITVYRSPATLSLAEWCVILSKTMTYEGETKKGVYHPHPYALFPLQAVWREVIAC